MYTCDAAVYMLYTAASHADLSLRPQLTKIWEFKQHRLLPSLVTNILCIFNIFYYYCNHYLPFTNKMTFVKSLLPDQKCTQGGCVFRLFVLLNGHTLLHFVLLTGIKEYKQKKSVIIITQLITCTDLTIGDLPDDGKMSLIKWVKEVNSERFFGFFVQCHIFHRRGLNFKNTKDHLKKTTPKVSVSYF